MCTLSWKQTEIGIVLLFNRDEHRSRLAALPPTLQQRKGAMFLSPIDPHHQGTWILVNEYALTLCLLNHYPSIAMPYIPNAPSRGLLPLMCADSRDVDEAIHRLLTIPPMSYMPFRFVAISPTRTVQATWDGRTLTTTSLSQRGGMLTSSSFRPDAVSQFRHATFRDMVGRIETASVEMLNAFHHHPGTDRAFGIHMSRPEACTHNITRVTVSSRTRQAVMHFEPLVSASSDSLPTEVELSLKSPSKCHDTRNPSIQPTD